MVMLESVRDGAAHESMRDGVTRELERLCCMKA